LMVSLVIECFDANRPSTALLFRAPPTIGELR